MAAPANGRAAGMSADPADASADVPLDLPRGYPFDLTGARFRRVDKATGAPTALRTVALLIVFVAHVGIALWLRHTTDMPPLTTAQRPIQVLLLERSPPPPPPSPEPPQRATESVAPVARNVGRMQATTVPIESPSTPIEDSKPPQSRLFSADGSVVGLRQQVEELNRRAGREATFDYQIPGIAEAETAFETKVAIQPETTRFDRYWQPTPDLLTEVLERAVKASTLTMSLPVPGMPGHRVGCAIVLVAASGGCGLSEPKVAVYDIDDPNTLSAAEAEACRTIWEKITTTRLQDEHRRLRAIYDLGCRLPLADPSAPKAEFRQP